jgi:hypothetical protein
MEEDEAHFACRQMARPLMCFSSGDGFLYVTSELSTGEPPGGLCYA